ncbi:MAG: radical SAM protein [Promethearchaeota archaeon]
MIDIDAILKKKTELLCKGIFLEKDLIEHYKSQGIEINFGRKGGAGPLGGRYFLFEDNTLVNVALWDNNERTNLVLKEKQDEFFQIFDYKQNDVFYKLKLVDNPKFYPLKTSDGVEMRKIALIHGVDCLATTIYQKCVYWSRGVPCKFCGIELSLKYDTTILEKTPEQLSEVIAVAKKQKRCSHVTLTSGTTAENDKGANRYIEILKRLKEDHLDIPLHIQIEPLENLEVIDKLKQGGADTIGIHIEILNDSLRKMITPGKYEITYESFKKSWKHAIDVFGKNQVETFVLTGFGESPDELIKELENVISIGVIPFITPVRAIPNRKSNLPLMNHETLLEIYKKTGELMKTYGVNPLEHKAGCVRCGGCSAIKEAYKVACLK